MRWVMMSAALLAFAAAAEPRLPTPLAPCQHFLGKLPNVTAALCDSAQLRDSGARSVQGVPLFVRDIAQPQAKLRVLVTGAIHGDELSSASLALHWVRLAVNEPLETAQPIHWRFVPVLTRPNRAQRQPNRR